MGLNLISTSSGDSYKTNPLNPNPSNFNITRIIKRGAYLIAIVNYPDCTNYEGDKILVFEKVSVASLMSLTKLDPHFVAKSVSPIARFAPDRLVMAINFITTLDRRDRRQK